jgi:hypothetical protein
VKFLRGKLKKQKQSKADKVMSRFISAVLLLGGTVLASPCAFAQFTVVANDLYMGFQNQNGGGTADYIINLGAASNIVGQSTVVNLSSSFSSSLFNDSSLQGTSSQIMGGVAGGSNAGNPSDIFLTQLRTSNIGTPALAGSSVTKTMTRAQDNSAYSAFAQINGPSAGTGFLDTSKSWENFVEPANSASTFLGTTGLNPDSQVITSNVLYEDLWETSRSSVTGSSPYTYLGYFTLNLTGGSPSLTFTSTNVPGALTSPIIISVNKTGSTVTVVSSNAVPTHTYQLQSSSSLNPVSWGNVGSSALASGTLVTNTDTSATASKQFYRVQGQ